MIAAGAMVAMPSAPINGGVGDGGGVSDTNPEFVRTSVMSMLLEAFPQGASVAVGFLTSLPLHLACACRRASLRAVRLLLAAFPQGAAKKDRLRRLPLHLACGAADGADAPREAAGGGAALNDAKVMEALLETHEDGASTPLGPDPAGMRRLPIHCVAEGPRPCDAAAVNVLLSVFEGGGAATDARDRLPLELLVMRPSHELERAALRRLLCANPRGAAPAYAIASEAGKEETCAKIRSLQQDVGFELLHVG